VLLGVLAVAILGVLAYWRAGDSQPSSGRPTASGRTATVRTKARAGRRPGPKRISVQLVERRTGSLPASLQDAAAASTAGRRVALLGGLTAADTSTDSILLATAGGAHRQGVLPSALHDAAAVTLGPSTYLFGGGDGTRQLDAIVRVAATGVTANVGHLPTPSSDQAATEIAGTAYVVGGYTGSRWLDTIVAWRPDSPARIVAHLPTPVRYAAVTAAGDKIVIAGGSLPNGRASDAVFEYAPARGRVVRLGSLPAPTTHAAAAALGDVAYVVGGRGASVGSATTRVVAVDLGSGRIRRAGRLSTPRSDLAAVTLGTRILVAGGRGTNGTESRISELVPRTKPARAPARRISRVPATPVGDVYAYDRTNMLAPVARTALPRIYVPNSESATVDVIDPHTFKVVDHFAVGALPQHVTPAYDLKTLYVTNDLGNSLTPIDPQTGKPGTPIPVDDPYNMYFTPDGRYAIVVAERLRRLDFRDAHSFHLHHSLAVPCVGVDHMDFSADGRYAIASCEFSGQMIKINIQRERVVGVLNLPDGRAGIPQDVKLSPDGRIFYVADLNAGGLWEIDGVRLRTVGFLRTGAGVHGLYPSRNGKLLYATNRGEGSISVISFRTRKVLRKWWIPGGGSPDMGGVSADGKVLWLTGRYSGVVYAISTGSGRLLAKIPVGAGPHGLCVWPQPGRYSLGHTGILR
jgi:DNA-binding beta-propeller fold protein YncE